MQPGRKPHFKIVFVYLLLGAAWIFFSDLLIRALFDSANAITMAQNIKGWAFIAITGILLYFLVKRDFIALQRANQEVIASYEQTIYGWVHVMDLRNKETQNHTRRVTAMTVELAKLAGIRDPEKLKQIERGAMLHDIGKIGIPDAILVKPGKLDEKERQIMRQHPAIGHDIVSNIQFLKPSAAIPFCHHEKWDGSGYPRGLKGEEIPLSARIFAIVDVWDALRYPRVYKAAWSENSVLEFLEQQAGIQFDPEIARLFLDAYEQLKRAALTSLENEESRFSHLLPQSVA